MNKQRRNLSMLMPTIITALFTLILVFIGYQKGQHIEGMKYGMDMLLRILPLLVFALIISGMVQVLFPRELLSQWLGRESGLRGIFIGTIAGACTPGGPYTSLPIAAALLGSGASIGTMVAFLTGWSLWAVLRLPLEIGIMGWKFTLIRLASVFFFPPIAGLIAQMISKIVK